jgi:hypothetical protein
MAKDSYEFAYMRKTEKRKIHAAKFILLASMLTSLWSLIDGDYSGHYAAVAAPYYDGSTVLAAAFGYINLLHIRSELTEIFEHPLDFKGKEFMIASLILLTFGMYKQFS